MDELIFPEPVTTRAHLFHRDHELDAVRAALGSPAPVVIQGERVTGKSSLLNVVATTPPHGHTAIRLPQVRTREELFAEVLDALAWEVDPSLPAPRPTSTSTFVRAATQLAERLGAVRLLVDELDSLLLGCPEPAAAQQILDALQLLAGTPGTTLRLVCTITRSVSQILGADTGHFMLGAHIVPLRPWTVAQARDVADRLLPAPLDDAAHHQLHAQAGGHPYLTKALLRALRADGGTDPAAVHRAAASELLDPGVDFTLDNIVRAHFTDDERALLLACARGHDPDGDPHLARGLIDRGYLVTDAAGPTHRYGLLAAWLLRRHDGRTPPGRTSGVRTPADHTSPGRTPPGRTPPEYTSPDRAHHTEPVAGQREPAYPQTTQLIVDLARGRIFLGERELDAGPLGYRFLARLCHTPGHVVDRVAMTAAVWSDKEAVTGIADGRVDALVHRLREAIGPDGDRYVQTRRGRGWLVDPALVRVVPGG